MKTLSAIAGLFLAAAATSSATVTLQFSSATVRATNWANGAGAGGTNLVWGVVVDAYNNGLAGSYYPNINFGAAPGTVQHLVDANGNATDDVLVLAQNPTILITTAVDGAAVGDNFISSVTSIPVAGTDGINTGDAFAIIWFDQTILSGNSHFDQKYGIFGNAAFTLPSDGSTVSYAFTTFVGPEPLKPMGYALVPEPSTALLGLLGIAGLIRRRR